MVSESQLDSGGDEQLEWVTRLLESHDIDWWVESGTLLSLTRSGGLTNYDDDIEVAMWASSYCPSSERC